MGSGKISETGITEGHDSVKGEDNAFSLEACGTGGAIEWPRRGILEGERMNLNLGQRPHSQVHTFNCYWLLSLTLSSPLFSSITFPQVLNGFGVGWEMEGL